MVTAFVLIKTDASRIPETAEEISAIPGISEVYSVTGEWDLIAIARVAKHEDLADVIADKLSKVPGRGAHHHPDRLPRLLPARPRRRLRPGLRAVAGPAKQPGRAVP